MSSVGLGLYTPCLGVFCHPLEVVQIAPTQLIINIGRVSTHAGA